MSLTTRPASSTTQSTRHLSRIGRAQLLLLRRQRRQGSLCHQRWHYASRYQRSINDETADKLNEPPSANFWLIVVGSGGALPPFPTTAKPDLSPPVIRLTAIRDYISIAGGWP